jgi:hypothetical protein
MKKMSALLIVTIHEVHYKPFHSPLLKYIIPVTYNLMPEPYLHHMPPYYDIFLTKNAKAVLWFKKNDERFQQSPHYFPNRCPYQNNAALILVTMLVEASSAPNIPALIHTINPIMYLRGRKLCSRRYKERQS